MLVAPSTLYKSLKVRDTKERTARAKLITDPTWTRLCRKPTSECSKNSWPRCEGVIRNGSQRKAIASWRKDFCTIGDGPSPASGTTCDDPDREAAQIAELPGEDLEIARAHANAQRKLMENSGNSGRKLATPLNNVKSVLHVWPPGYSGAAVHPWRINAWSSMSQALSIPTHPYREWLAADLNVMAALRDGGTWLRFWFDEVREDRMPRFWLRWAFEHLQMFAAVTLGTPGDAQLGTYLPEAEFFLVCGQEFHTNDGYAAALRALSALP